MDQAGVPVSVWWEKSRYEASIPEIDLCNGCGVCVDRCQFDAIQMVDSEVGSGLIAAIAPEKCFGCGACAVSCEPNAIKMKAVRPPEFIPGAVAQA
jgi:MinD superfamily P-loop ATPase